MKKLIAILLLVFASGCVASSGVRYRLYSVQIGHPIRSKAAGQSGPKQPGGRSEATLEFFS
jgi:hypothetical protein